ncbi:autotransporter-associated beta strand repeat-containing protein [Chania multitudinisentens]|nr:autotransporter-associated beta strand repeat-containing protein [Chania multitudinisentens]
MIGGGAAIAAPTVVPAGSDIYTYLNGGNYELLLSGNAVWNTVLPINSAARSTIFIDGAGNTVTVGLANRLFDTISQNNTNLTLNNTTFTTPVSTTNARANLFNYAYNVNSLLTLDGTTFTGFGGTNTGATGAGANILYVNSASANVTVDGGVNGVTFANNRSTYDAAGAVALNYGTLNFNGSVTFDNNWTGNYGGAMSVYSVTNAANFNGTTLFRNNHATVFGGALDIWGGPSTISFNGPTTFDGNYIYYQAANSGDSPTHINDQHPRGGAINIGYVSPGAAGTSVIFNSATSFLNNYVVSTGALAANRNALGGAISAYGNGAALLYRYIFNAPVLFEGNYVYTTNAAGVANGGAIYYDSSAALIDLSSGAQFLGNYAKNFGGAIYLQSGTINLNATTDDIRFEGNYQGASFDGSTNAYRPILGSGIPNAIYLGSSGNLNFNATSGNKILFYDPIASIAGSTVTVTKTGDGEVIFYGDNGATSNYDSNIRANTVVSGGYFTLDDAVKYGVAGTGTFIANTTGTVRGGHGAQLNAQTVTIQSGGSVAVNGGDFTVNANTFTIQNSGGLSGSGTLLAPSNITLAGSTNVNITGTDQLNIAANLVGAGLVSKTGSGTLNLQNANTYTGTTIINDGTLLTSVANAFASSSAVTISSGATLALNNFNQVVNLLFGSGNISLGTATLTENNALSTIFSGVITGSGNLVKNGTGAITLSGNSSYSGGTSINAGRIIATEGSALGTGAVANSATMELAFDSDKTLSNTLSGAGAFVKSGTGNATLTSSGSSQGAVSVNQGTLTFAQNGVFNSGSYTTATGANTTIGNTAQLNVNGAFTQSAGSSLFVDISNNPPLITATSAALNGVLSIIGFSAPEPNSASAAFSTLYSILETTSGISGDFSSKNISGAASSVDYLTISANKSIDNLRYQVGYGLTWQAGSTLGDGTFTLTGPGDSFNLDVALNDEAASLTGWNGHDLTKAGAGTLTLSAQNGYTGTTTVSGGTLSLGITDALAASSALTLDSGTTLALNDLDQTVQQLGGAGNVTLGSATLTASNSGSSTFSGEISGSGNLVKTGSGTLTLSGNNGYTGTTTVDGGTLSLGIADALAASSAVTLGSGTTLALNGLAQIVQQLGGAGNVTLGSATLTASNSGSSTFSGGISGSGDLVKIGSGTLTLSGNNSYTGTTTVSEGTLSLGIADALAASSALMLDSGTTLALNGLSQIVQQLGGAGNVTLGSATLTASNSGNSTFSGGISGSGNLVKTGNGTLTLSGSNGYTGTTTVSGGILSLGVADALAASSAVTLGSGTTLALNDLDQTVQQLGGAGNVTLGSATLTASNSGSSTFSGIMSGSGDLVKIGSGTLTLSGSNSYTGTTTVNEGTLSLGVTDALAASSALTLDSGSTLALNDLDQTVQQLGGAGNVTLGSATLTASNSGSSTFSGEISGSGNLVKTGSGTLTLSGNNGYTGTTTVDGGTLSLGIADALAASSAVTLGSGTTLALNDLDQTVQQLGGAGSVTLGSATLTASNSGSSTFSGGISGSGELVKTGSGALTLTGDNSYSGGTTVSDGSLVVTQGNALGSGTVTNDADLELAFAGDGTLDNGLSGSGTLTKSGSGNATLTASGSSQGSVEVDAGTLTLAQSGAFTAGDYTTASGATTAIASDAQLVLSGALTQASGAVLQLGIGNNDPAITALSATLGGALQLSGYSGTLSTNASDLASTLYTVLQTSTGISGDFDSVDLGVAGSPPDYLTLAAGTSSDTLRYQVGYGLTWQAGSTLGDGTFTLASLSDSFNLDMALNDESASLTGWNGRDLTKAGAGTLILSAQNGYTGTTTVSGGTLSLGVTDALAASSAVTLGSGTTLALNDLDQTVQQLGGAGSVTLGNATLTASNSGSSTFSGIMSGSGELVKTGSGALTLTGDNSYSGGTTVSDGSLVVTQGNALGSGTVTNDADLELAFAGDGTLDNGLSGSGTLTKSGSGNATLTASGSSQGSVEVDAGTLTLAQSGAFTAGDYTTASGATTAIASDAQLVLSGALTQASGAVLQLGIGNNDPAITALSATLGGALQLSGYSVTIPTSASDLASTLYTVLQTSTGISGDFDSVDLGVAGSPPDYLTLAAGTSSDTLRYQVGYGLTWQAGSTLGDGTFTLASLSDSFNLDMALNDESASLTGWNGRDLTKAGAGTLILSAQNGYTGTTTVDGGTLSLGITDALAASSAVTLGSGTTLALNDLDQTVQQLGGAGNVTLGSATLTASNSGSSTFSGGISGSGELVKTGSGALTLTGDNSYSGGTTVSDGSLVVTQGNALGSGTVTNDADLELAFAGDGTLDNGLSGSGTLTKSGSGNATLTASGSSQGSVEVDAGTLTLAQSGAFTAGDYTTASGATTAIASDAQLVLSGALTQASGAVLQLGIGNNDPAITALSATLSGALQLSGYSVTTPTSASDLTSTLYTVLQTSTGISGDFDSVSLGSAGSPLDYLTLAAGTSSDTLRYQVGYGLTWQAGSTLGDGTFTLASLSDSFNLDMALNDESASLTGWNGRDLTKAGAGTLILSAQNGYTGTTTVSGGTLSLGVTDALAASSAVTLGSGTTLALNDLDQTVQQLGGAGSVTLGNATLTASNSGSSTFSGIMSGSGELVKTGSGALTLTGDNSYSGGTTVSDGSLVVTQGNALGSGTVTNDADLELAFAGDGTLDNGLSGSGTLTKSGSGNATLTASGSSQGSVEVDAGTLTLAQSGAFTAGDYTTASGATTAIASDAQLVLSGALTQASGAVLQLGIGNNDPAITALSATLSGALQLSGYSVTTPTSASDLTSTLYTVLQTSTGISGDFDSVSLGSAGSPLDYLTLAAGKSSDTLRYQVGYGLTWQAGSTLGDGTFTLASLSDSFNLDMALNDESASLTGWNGRDLTKAGAGTLILSAQNGYTGTTTVSGGTLSLGVTDALAASSAVTLGSGTTLALNDLDQTVQQLGGAGNVTLGSATLTASNSGSSTFSGDISGSGELVKTGSGALTLTGDNSYSGGTTVSDGSLVVTQGNALGSGTVTNDADLELAFAGDGTLDNGLSGSGTLTKSGSGNATLTASGSSQGSVEVDAGTLTLAQSGAFTAGDYTTASGATTAIASDAQLVLSGALTQASGAVLQLGIGNNDPAITALSATLSGALQLSGYSVTTPTSASDLTSTLYTVLQTSTGISGDFDSVSLGSAGSPLDYLTLAAGKSSDTLRYQVGYGLTWQAGSTLGDGTFTLASLSDSFNLDMALNDESASLTGWNGRDLTKAGAGTLILSAQNGYTGTTTVSGGTLSLGVTDALAASSAVTLGSGTTLALNDLDQTVQQLGGAGSVTLGSATLTASNSGSSTFSGGISGSGELVKTGSGALTLTGDNSYSGSTTVSDGSLVVTQGNALGSGTVTNNADLELAFVGDSTLDNGLSGSGTLTKSGSGNATLTASGSSQGSVEVDAGTLTLAQSGAFTAGDYTTASGATTAIAPDAQLVLSGALTQASGAVLQLGIGNNDPAITALSATLSGALQLSGYSVTIPTSASDLTSTLYTVLQTSTGISGDFDSVSLGSAGSPLDYLTLAAGKSSDTLRYQVGYGLTWQAGSTLGDGTFTLASLSDSFNLDMALNDESASLTGWNGRDLTKAGAGTLILSAQNGYTGTTTVSGGTLSLGITDALAASSAVTLGSGTTLALNDLDQTVQQLGGAGNVTLGSATLTASNSGSSTFSGGISGSGELVKTGSGALTLTGDNSYSGGTTVSDGSLVVTQGNALGSGTVTNNADLELAFAGDGTLDNGLSGSGTLTKSGSGNATLTASGSSQGSVEVDAGTLTLAQSGAFTAGDYTTASGATTAIAPDAQLVLSGALTQASGAVLQLGIGNNDPAITALSATLSGALQLSGYSGTLSTNASDLTSTLYTVLQTSTGISGDFDSVSLGSAGSPLDYLTLAAGKSSDTLRYQVGYGLTWQAGSTLGDGTFTLASLSDSFNLDMALNDESASLTGWNGRDLTKAGAGTLILSAQNGYTGTTTVSGGTLSLGVTDALAASSAVTLGSGTTLALNDLDQTVQQLGGAGSVTLGSATLTASNSGSSTFSGIMSGSGELVKTGSGALTLTGDNSYSGGTTVSDGSLVVTQGNALGSGTVTNDADLELAFAGDGTLDNGLSGSGTLTKSGSGNATLTVSGSSQGSVDVEAGRLTLAQGVVFNAGDYTTASGATSTINPDAQLILSGVLTQASDSILQVGINLISPAISASSALLAGELQLAGYSAIRPATASGLTSTLYTVIQTTTGLSGDFSFVDFGGSTSEVDYLTLAAGKSSDDLLYQVGYALTWQAGNTLGDGTFTLTEETFNLDLGLSDQGSSATGWNGRDLTKNGSGTLILSADNTYTGVTTINDGTLQVGNGGTQGSIEGNVVNNSLLTFDRSDALNFAGEITGSGTLQQVGSGVLTLSGNSDYAGGTVISSGALHLGNGGTEGMITGNVLNNALLAFDRSDDATFAGQISGSGTLWQIGSGTVVLTGDNTYSGGTFITAGTLQIGDGGTQGSIIGNINNDGTLIVNRSDDIAYAGSLSGNGTFIKEGNNSLQVSGDSSGYLGDTFIEAGSLMLDSTAILGGSLEVLNGAKLGGSGTVGNAVIASGGTLSPGHSIGTLNVAGNLTFEQGSQYLVEVNPTGTESDLIHVTGTTTLNGGSVVQIGENGNYRPLTTYTIITSDQGINGQFDSVSSDYAFVTPTLSYDANNVMLSLLRNQVDFVSMAKTPNQKATARGAESLGSGGVYDAIVLLGQDIDVTSAAFDQISGELYASSKAALIEDSRFVREAANNRLRGAFGHVATEQQAVKLNSDDDVVSWGQAFGAWGATSGDGNAARLNRDTGGILLGGDKLLKDNWRVGVIGGYSHTNFDVKDRNSSGSSNNYHLGIYGGNQWDKLSFRSALAYTWHDISTERSPQFSGFSDRVTGDYRANTVQTFGELGYTIQKGNTQLEPFANLTYLNLHTNGLREQGGAAALNINSSNTDATFSSLGVRSATDLTFGDKPVKLKGTLGWRHNFGAKTPTSTQSFSGGDNFTVASVPIAKDAAIIETGLEIAVTPNAKVGVSYSGQFGSGSSRDQSALATFNWKF